MSLLSSVGAAGLFFFFLNLDYQAAMLFIISLLNCDSGQRMTHLDVCRGEVCVYVCASVCVCE